MMVMMVMMMMMMMMCSCVCVVAEEEAYRFLTFCTNLKRIKTMQESEQGSATYGVNKFADISGISPSLPTTTSFHSPSCQNYLWSQQVCLYLRYFTFTPSPPPQPPPSTPHHFRITSNFCQKARWFDLNNFQLLVKLTNLWIYQELYLPLSYSLNILLCA